MASEIVNGAEQIEGSVSVKVRGSSLVHSSKWKWLIYTDSKTVTREEVLFGTPGIPIAGVFYGPLNMQCVGKDAKRKPEDPQYWYLEADFESGAENQKPAENDPDNPDPTTWIPVFQVTKWESKQKALAKESRHYADPALQKYCINTAGDPFSEPIVVVRKLPVITFTQYEDPSTTLAVINARNEKINATAIAGYDADTLKLNVVYAGLGYYMGYPAWKVDYELVWDPDTWVEERLDIGPNYIGTSSKKLPYMDDNNLFKIVGPLDGSTGAKASDPLEPGIVELWSYDLDEFNDFIRTA